MNVVQPNECGRAEQMIQNIKAMHKKSQQTSMVLMDMVQELSEITERSTKSNEQIVRETGNVLESFSQEYKRNYRC